MHKHKHIIIFNFRQLCHTERVHFISNKPPPVPAPPPAVFYVQFCSLFHEQDHLLELHSMNNQISIKPGEAEMGQFSSTAFRWNFFTRELQNKSGTVNSKSFVGKVLLRIKWKFESISTTQNFELEITLA